MLYILYLTLGQKSWRIVIWSTRHFANFVLKNPIHLALLAFILCFIIKRARLQMMDTSFITPVTCTLKVQRS